MEFVRTVFLFPVYIGRFVRDFDAVSEVLERDTYVLEHGDKGARLGDEHSHVETPS